MSGESFWQQRHHSPQAAALLRFMLDGPGKGLKGAKTFLEDYFTALREYVHERRAAAEKEEKKDGESPKTEEEEEEEFQRRQQQWKEKEQELLKDVFERAFGEWSESTWMKLERSYLKFVS